MSSVVARRHNSRAGQLRSKTGTSRRSARPAERVSRGSTNVLTTRCSASSVPFVSSKLLGATPKCRRPLPAHGFLLGIGRDGCGAELRERAAHGGRAADGVLVEIEAQLVGASFERRMVGTHLFDGAPDG